MMVQATAHLRVQVGDDVGMSDSVGVRTMMRARAHGGDDEGDVDVVCACAMARVRVMERRWAGDGVGMHVDDDAVRACARVMVRVCG